jgi:anti-sigma28 factor (negative regulator of flagellin synthesis)
MIGGAWQQGMGHLKRHGLPGEALALGANVVVPFTNTPSNILARVLDYAGPGAAVRMGHAAYTGARGGSAPPAPATKKARGTPDFAFGGQAGPPVGTGRGGGGSPPPPPAGGAASAASAGDAKKVLKQADLTESQQKLFSMAFGRGAQGLALMLLGYWLASKGLATGVRDEDEGVRNIKEAAGHTPGSIKVGGTWRQVSRFSPFGNLLTIGATMHERGLSASSVLGTSMETVAEQPMLKGASETLDAMDRPTTFGQTMASSTLGGAVPTMLSDIAATFDPYRRDARPEGDLDLHKGAQSRFPGTRNQLPVKTDIFGEPMAQNRTKIIDPTNPTSDKTDDVTSELLRLRVGVGKPDQSKAENETAAEFRARRDEIGQQIRLQLEETIGSAAYQDADDDEKVKQLRRAINEGRARVSSPTKRREE